MKGPVVVLGPGSRGLALVLVLWVTALLAVLASGLVQSVRTEARITQNVGLSAQRDALQSAVGHYVAAQLMLPREQRDIRTGGIPNRWSWGGHEAVIRVFDASGLVSLNQADANVLSALVERAAGVEAKRAAAIADAILDWRDPDDARRPGGAEDPDYASREMPWEAKDGAFEAIAELRGVMGVTAAIYARLAPLVSVHAGQVTVDSRQAPAGVLRALADDEAAADRFLQQREIAGESPGSAPAPLPGRFFGSGRGGGNAYRVIMELRMSAGRTEVVRHSSIRLPVRPGDPLRIVPLDIPAGARPVDDGVSSPS